MRQIEIPEAPHSEICKPAMLYDDDFIGSAIEAVRTAKARIDICAYAWKWYQNSPEMPMQVFNYEIARAVQRGIEVRAILDQTGQADYLKQYGIRAKTFPTHRVMHTKALLVDEKLLILGSHNLTNRANSSNFEISIAIQDTEIALQFSEYFTKMWRNYAV